jgi:hypothetical protein
MPSIMCTAKAQSLVRGLHSMLWSPPPPIACHLIACCERLCSTVHAARIARSDTRALRS